MEFENLLINTKNNITTISINRPKNLNALNIKTLDMEKTPTKKQNSIMTVQMFVG